MIFFPLPLLIFYSPESPSTSDSILIERPSHHRMLNVELLYHRFLLTESFSPVRFFGLLVVNGFKKKNPDGSVARHKARLVAKGYHQVQGFDFDHETFSPVVKKPTIRIIPALTAQYNWSITQLDVKSVFLHGILQETVYMSQPTSF